LARKEEIAVATVVYIHGSAPRPEGARLVVTRSGEMRGSVSGGCVEGDVYERAMTVLDEGSPALVSYGPAEPDSFEVGLSCDGEIEVLIEPHAEDVVFRGLRDAIAAGEPAALALVLDPPQRRGARLALVGKDSNIVGSIDTRIDEVVAEEAREVLGRGTRTTRTIELEGQPHRVFIESFVPAPRLYVVGATHIAETLCRLAREVGFEVCLIEPRTAFTRGERFAAAHEIRSDWPVDVLDGARLDGGAYILTLTHDSKFDIPTLARALRSDVRYIGALGSRGTHEKRKTALREQGFGEADLARIHTPVGLDLGGRSPQEIALAILAEMVAARYARTGVSLNRPSEQG
jgi:xanthine dehydrogenase accessory factor